jgi:hypothetical protein
MSELKLEHFKRAAMDVGAHGDNDTLPFDIDNRFVKERQDALAELAYAFAQELAAGSKKSARNAIDGSLVFSERLLAPTGAAGFRIATKIHPFWNVYLNGLGVAVAETLEPTRSDRAHSYRFVQQGEALFDRASSWRAFREATIVECKAQGEESVVVQTDISSFYEHVSHHRLENCLDDLLSDSSTVPTQIDRLLNRFAAGRSFGLPVGGQCSRVLAEVLLASVDRCLSDARVIWRRYVDDFVLITSSQSEAYGALAILSHGLADYGLTLNRTKTTLLSGRHYVDYVHAQLGKPTDDAGKLSEIDLHFDPYSDTADSDYEELRQIVESLDIRSLLDLELQKAQPDTFLVAQIGRTLKLHSPAAALQLCTTLLCQPNLHAFRASWSTIMRGVSAVRADPQFAAISRGLDALLDAIPDHSAHLLRPEASCLHYLRTLRFQRTDRRAQYVYAVHSFSSSDTIRRACIDCWRFWSDRASFTRERNRWNALSAEEQRMLWVAAGEFGDEGVKFRQQARQSLAQAWGLGIERSGKPTFATIYAEWAANVC